MEIGSIFEIDIRGLFDTPDQADVEFPFMHNKAYSIDYYNTGRAAIESLFRYLKHNKNVRAFLPTYNCSSVYEAVKRAGVHIELYKVDRNLSFDSDELKGHLLRNGDIFYLVQYFGRKLSQNELNLLNELKKDGVIIVEDITLCLLSSHATVGIGDYIVSSIRKWLALPDGAFIATQGELPVEKKNNAANDYTLYYFSAQVMKQYYLNDPSLDKAKYLNLNNKAMDALFSDLIVREMSAISLQLMKAFDLFAIAKTREDNYKNLCHKLCEIPQVKIMIPWEEGVVPIGIVIAVEERDKLFAYLIKNDIYCNIHWRTNIAMNAADEAMWLAGHLITIPCDQRYSGVHMKKIEKVIREFFDAKYVQENC